MSAPLLSENYIVLLWRTECAPRVKRL